MKAFHRHTSHSHIASRNLSPFSQGFVKRGSPLLKPLQPWKVCPQYWEAKDSGELLSISIYWWWWIITSKVISVVHTVICEQLKLQLVSGNLWWTCDWIVGLFTRQEGTRRFVHRQFLYNILFHHTAPIFEHFFISCLLLVSCVRSCMEQHQFFLFFNFLMGSWFLNFFFILNNSIFTVVGIPHFRLVKFSTFQTWTVF